MDKNIINTCINNMIMQRAANVMQWTEKYDFYK